MDYYIPSSNKVLSQKRLEEYDNFCNIINWGRRNPVLFAEEFFGIKLFDFQKWIFMKSWVTPYCLWLLARGGSKTTLAAIFLMTKALLIPDYMVYLAANSSKQSIESIKKIEDIALQRIPSFETATGVFANEVVKGTNSPTGFLHDPAGHKFRLYNNSGVETLSSNETTIRGKRGSLFADEGGWQPLEYFNVTENFINVDKSFSMGTSKIQSYNPIQMPLQLLYASSASDTTFPFYDKYKMYSKKMLLGDPSYFVCDLNCDVILYHSTKDGQPIKSHLKEDQIKKEIEETPDLAMRELYNKFSHGGGLNRVVTMEALVRNSTVRVPLLYNDTSKKKFVFCYDPARNYDNSILSIFQVIDDKEVGFKLQLENMVSFVDTQSNRKTPLPMPTQIEMIKQLMISYNGERAADWENILFYIDAGSGGGGKSAIADYLVADWKDSTGRTRKGIIDPDHPQYETLRNKYKNAAKIVRLIEPTSHKKLIFDSLEKMVKLDLINFFEYDGKEFIFLIDKNGDTVERQLSQKEYMPMVQCNLAKEELMYMTRYESPNGGVQYDMAKDKKNKLHDDRSYTIAEGAYALACMRRDDLTSQPKETPTTVDFQFRKPNLMERR